MTRPHIAEIAEIGRRAEATYPGVIRAHVIAGGPIADGPAPDWLDPEGSLRRILGARATALALVRPDGYLGYRGQPASWDDLRGYLDRYLARRPGLIGDPRRDYDDPSRSARPRDASSRSTERAAAAVNSPRENSSWHPSSIWSWVRLRPIRVRGKGRALDLITPHSGTRTVPVWDGAVMTLNLANVIHRMIYMGAFSPHITAHLRALLPTGGTFLDVGANIGYFSLVASRLVGPSGRVLAAEPNPGAFGR